ncbi:MAG: two-component regulator propeller domain-containing protein [Bacteroidota bacterium]
MKTLFLLSFFFVCAVFSAVGQKISFEKYDLHDGLPGLQVTDLFVDSKGYLWVGTKSGLVRFDGKQFEYFGDRITGNSRYAMTEIEGKIWVVTTAGIYVVNQKGQVTRYPLPEFPEGYYANVTGSVTIPKTKDGKNFYYFAIKERPKQGTEHPPMRAYRFNTQEKKSEFICETVAEDGTPLLCRGLWRGNKWYAYHLDTEGYRTHYTYDPITQKAERLEDFDGEYIQTLPNNTTSFLVSTKSGEMSFYQAKKLLGRITDVEYHYKNLSVITEDSYHFVSDNFPFLNYNGEWYEFPKIQPTSITEDNKGNLWIGTEKGLYKIPARPFFYFDESHGLPNINLWGFNRNKSNWWVVGYQNGLYQLSRERKPQKSDFNLFMPSPLPKGWIEEWYPHFYFGVRRTSDEKLIFPHGFGTLYLDSTGKSGAWDNILNKDLASKANLSSHIDEARKEVLSFGLPGIRWFNFSGEQTHFLPKERHGKNTFDVAPLGGNNYFLALGSKQALYDRSTGELDFLTFPANGDSTLQRAGLTTLAKDKYGNIWGGHHTHGLWLWENGKFSRIRPDLIDGIVETVAVVNEGRILLASHKIKGLLAIHLERYYRWREAEDKSTVPNPFYWFDKSNGFEFTQEPQQNSLVQDLDNPNRVMFTTGDAKAYFVDIDTTIFDLQPLYPFIQQAESYNKDSLSWSVHGERFMGDDTIRLPINNRGIRLELHAPTQDSPEQLRFAYRTRRGKSEWKEWETLESSQLQLPILQPFETEIEIKSYYQFQTPEMQRITTRYVIYVAPFWYETLWGKAGSVLAAVLFGLGIYTFADKQRKKKEQDKQRILDLQLARKREQEERERKEEEDRVQMENLMLRERQASLRAAQKQEEIAEMSSNLEETNAQLEKLSELMNLISALRALGDEGEVDEELMQYKGKMNEKTYALLEELQLKFSHFEKLQRTKALREEGEILAKSTLYNDDSWEETKKKLEDVYPGLMQVFEKHNLSKTQIRQMLALWARKSIEPAAEQAGISVNSLHKAYRRVTLEKLQLEKPDGITFPELLLDWMRRYI